MMGGGRVSKNEFGCPLCGGSLELERGALIHNRINKKTGHIGRVYIYDKNDGLLHTLHCGKCDKHFIGYSDRDSYITQIDNRPLKENDL